MIRYHFGLQDGGTAQRGKRLRPALLLRVTLEEGGALADGLPAAAAVEILHNYSLVHDDIEDGDELRRGRPTVWARYGVPHGINVGDSMCAMSYLALIEGGGERRHDGARVTPMLERLHRANLEMCEGQGLDIAFESAVDVTMPQYLEMIAGKTAALFAAACELGALSAGTPPERARAYAEFGRAYGTAFQIRDDVLGTWGTPERTGKPSGADIARRKWTFPVVWALESPPSRARRTIAAAYAQLRALDSGEVEDVIEALDALRAREAADEAYDRQFDAAGRIAREHGLDARGTLRDFLAHGARRVA